ncbi:MgtC/SapB family protein [Phototrophicus methaneseepsis]|uniref:MgtC/SapB family protein n=1 Tax=Phototrophicus methaneseepsis TaxID=2710758 RepID=A0A7S8IG29_9CHLR|nr:MgtC/SapB family protein [Phototrophicus methaneseepsis]QPC84256.1 MgtC/SapB family protein [Phototrophicus methaneseepsis]
MTSLLSLEEQIVLALNLTLALVLSSVIGMNRDRVNKSAGLRTHMLTGTGSCLFTIVSMYAFPDADSSRVAANIVTGIGFLGGGIIIQRKNETYDVTTAAGVWATAAIGMAVGVGAWFLAIYATIMVWVTLALLKRVKTVKLPFNTGRDENDDLTPLNSAPTVIPSRPEKSRYYRKQGAVINQ